MKNNILYIVVHCYNESEVLEETTKRLKEKIIKLIDKKIILIKVELCMLTMDLKTIHGL